MGRRKKRAQEKKMANRQEVKRKPTGREEYRAKEIKERESTTTIQSLSI